MHIQIEWDFSEREDVKPEVKRKGMTAKAALCKALLDGETLNVKNVFTTIGLTNCAREISRMVEQPFGVEVSRVHREGSSRYGQAVTWTDYHLNTFTDRNKEGIEKMREYVKQHS